MPTTEKQVAEQNNNTFQPRTRNDICKYIKLNIQTFLYKLLHQVAQNPGITVKIVQFHAPTTAWNICATLLKEPVWIV